MEPEEEGNETKILCVESLFIPEVTIKEELLEDVVQGAFVAVKDEVFETGESV